MVSFTTFVCSILVNSFCAYASAPPITGTQSIPQNPPGPGTFSNGAVLLTSEPPTVPDIPDAIYGARDIDIPFFRLYHGNLNFFQAGELNTPTANRDLWGTENDNANQSACGIPDNAFFISKVAIHPYFLKYADLSRYCMQDVCISFWKEDGSSDMMLKVTDICSTDPNDPTSCATPADIKVDRTKVMIMEGIAEPTDPRLTGNSFPDQIWWFFTKCWDDGLAQPAYQGNNWFTNPPIPNNINWSMSTAGQQYRNNQLSYPAKGWPTYPDGGYNTERDSTISPPISDWAPGQPDPAWSPLAGGVGWGKPSPASPPPPPAPPAPSSPPPSASSSTSAADIPSATSTSVSSSSSSSTESLTTSAVSSSTQSPTTFSTSTTAASSSPEAVDSSTTQSTASQTTDANGSSSVAPSSTMTTITKTPCPSIYPSSSTAVQSSSTEAAPAPSSSQDAPSVTLTSTSAAPVSTTQDASSSTPISGSTAYPTCASVSAVTVTVTQTFTNTVDTSKSTSTTIGVADSPKSHSSAAHLSTSTTATTSSAPASSTSHSSSSPLQTLLVSLPSTFNTAHYNWTYTFIIETGPVTSKTTATVVDTVTVLKTDVVTVSTTAASVTVLSIDVTTSKNAAGDSTTSSFPPSSAISSTAESSTSSTPPSTTSETTPSSTTSTTSSSSSSSSSSPPPASSSTTPPPPPAPATTTSTTDCSESTPAPALMVKRRKRNNHVQGHVGKRGARWKDGRYWV